MPEFKSFFIKCQKCGKDGVQVKRSHFEAGYVVCFHPNCGHTNRLVQRQYYDSRVLTGITHFGSLRNLTNSSVTLPIQEIRNVMGRSSTCQIPVERIVHNGKCYISNRHCTLLIAFDIWTGKLRYQLSDGAQHQESGIVEPSKNGTWLNGYRLQKDECIDVPPGGIINLGGMDLFQLEVLEIPKAALDTYKCTTSTSDNEITE